ncbi:MAG TPA: ABC transporter permease subunit [Acidimicrobiales bacterium]|nr:ABC transporter permease subunit [Acidimicrobiales bacterium]HTV10603.1 ABC transporter permease subunit [Acidimicrobiales bacterium]
MAVVTVDEVASPPRRKKGGSLDRPSLREQAASLAFLVPGAIWLLAIVIYPAVVTVKDSFFNETDTKAVGLTNYKNLFTTAETLIAFRNNVIWVIIFPFVVTTIGLVLAVLTERIRWATAFKTVIFLPVVFSVTASSMVFTQIFDTSPQVGVANALIQTVSDWFSPPGAYPLSPGTTAASLASYGATGGPHGTVVTTSAVNAGSAVKIGLTGFPPTTFQALGARQAVLPKPAKGDIVGVVWRDFSANNPTNTSSILPGEDGYPLMHLSLLNTHGSPVASATTGGGGQFVFSNVGPGAYKVSVDASNFAAGFGAGGVGVSWLGGQSLTPTGGLGQTEQALLSVPLVDISMIIAYLWIWAGFTMVVVGAGLAALDRQALEAAKVDGATEWQTLRRVTIPMLAPVLVVVLVTMIINVLKIFDIVINMAYNTSEPGGQASTLASDVYFKGFTNGIHTGLASALAVILFVLVIPAMLFNLKRIKGGGS